MKSWPFVIATLMLVCTWGTLQSFSDDERVLPKKPFEEFPLHITGEAARWNGKELGLEQNVLDVLKLTDYMMRVYVPVDSKTTQVTDVGHEEGVSKHTDQESITGPVWLYVGYYKSQRTGKTYHSPKNCLPGAGWQFVQSDFVTLPLPGTSGVTINKVLIQKGLEKQVILYWYQDRGRVIASEYWAKGYMIWDAMTKNRTDGSLVRISIPVHDNPNHAYERGEKFLRDMWPTLLDFMPDSSMSAT